MDLERGQNIKIMKEDLKEHRYLHDCNPENLLRDKNTIKQVSPPHTIKRMNKFSKRFRTHNTVLN